MPKSDFLQEATERGFLHQCTDTEALDQALTEGPVSAYIGFDCTADSLHVGSLVQIMALRLLQKHGHRPFVLLGGGTTRIGDPTGRDESRQMLSDGQIAANMRGIARVFAPFSGSAKARRMPISSTTRIGWISSAISRCCATSARISRSTGCLPSIASGCGSNASSR